MNRIGVTREELGLTRAEYAQLAALLADVGLTKAR